MGKEVFKIFDVLSNEEKEKYLMDMSKYQRNLFNELENDYEKASKYNLNDLIYDFDKDFVEKILELEIEQYLEENPLENRKNGYTKGITLTIGDRVINYNRPRLRSEKEFDSEIIPKRKRFIDDISENIITLYAKNNSVKDIEEIMKVMFGIKISTAKISQICQTIADEVMKWRNKELNQCYFTLNIDCTYINIRDNKKLTGHKVPIYIAVGTKLDGHKEIVGMYLGNEDENKNVIDEMYNIDIAESKTFWLTVFNDLKDRGLEKVLYVVSDGLAGIEEAVKDEFPTARYQRCIVHLVRNLKKYTNKNESKEVIGDFKKIYTSSTKEESEEMYKKFIEKYKNKKTIINHVKEYYKYIEPLFDVPINIRKYIYTNNIVESANSKIKRGFYGRGALPNVESAINIIYINIKDLEGKWTKTKVKNWENIFSEIITIYQNQIKEYL